MGRICTDVGHVEVDHDRVCLACEARLIATDWVSIHIVRPEGHHTGDVDSDYGPAHTGQE
jgi:hypothetical protein